MMRELYELADCFVTTHSIRYRILKGVDGVGGLSVNRGYNPFDPIQDTESGLDLELPAARAALQPIRSDTGY